MFKSDNDPIGFNPTQNQSEFGTPQRSVWGFELKATPVHGILDYFPTWPYRGLVDFTGAQFFAPPTTESIFARTHLYIGIAPIALQPLVNAPYPYEEGLPNW